VVAPDSSAPALPRGKATAAILALYAIIAAALLLSGASTLPPPQGIVASVFLALMLAILSAIDLETFRLPDALTLPLIVTGLAAAFLSSGSEALFWRAMAAAGAFALLATVAYVYERLRGEPGLGLGDAKLFAAAGSWLGAEPLPSVMLIATLTALALVVLKALRDRHLDPRMRLAFGPFIAFGFWCAWLWSL
jgi:leader peptidase (prepilin peptidase)/N-methyltransferase